MAYSTLYQSLSIKFRSLFCLVAGVQIPPGASFFVLILFYYCECLYLNIEINTSVNHDTLSICFLLLFTIP